MGKVVAEFNLPTRRQRMWFDEMNGTLTWLKQQIENEATARANADNLSAKKASNLSDLSDASVARTNLGLGTAATADSTDFDPAGAAQAVLVAALQRSNHTGTQPSSTISDFTEAAQDAIAALLQGASGVTLSYDDEANTLTITGGGAGGGTLDEEAVRDAIGVALVGAGLINIVVNDAADTITISTTATQNSTDAALRDRQTHTGVQAISTVNGLQTELDSKVDGSEVGAANGVASLDSSGKVPDTQLPSPALPNLFMRRIDENTWGPRPTDDPNVGCFIVGADPSPPVVTSGTAGMYAGDIRMRES